MSTQSPESPPQHPTLGVIESREPHRRTFLDYRGFIRNHYDGLPGALTSVTGLLTGHEALAGRLISPRAFDVRGCKQILDAGCGNGRYSKFLLRQADPDAVLTGFDISVNMLGRAQHRLQSPRVSLAAADLTRLPYADGTFDAAVSGWVLEHLPDPRPGLKELARVLRPGGKLLLLSTEDTFTGAMCSRLWHCRTYNRPELKRICQECGLHWERELWFSHLHRWLQIGGIIVDMRRDGSPA
jgi:SAM-dependent methyltransferase